MQPIRAQAFWSAFLPPELVHSDTHTHSDYTQTSFLISHTQTHLVPNPIIPAAGIRGRVRWIAGTWWTASEGRRVMCLNEPPHSDSHHIYYSGVGHLVRSPPSHTRTHAQSQSPMWSPTERANYWSNIDDVYTKDLWLVLIFLFKMLEQSTLTTFYLTGGGVFFFFADSLKHHFFVLPTRLETPLNIALSSDIACLSS